MKKNIKNILVYMLIYYIPVMIFVKTTPYLISYFAGKKQCVSDYFLYFLDWKNSAFVSTLEIVVISIIMVVSIIKEQASNRVILYDSMQKLWLVCIKRVIVITYIVPFINSVVIALTALSNGAGWQCNWNETESVARAMVPYGDIVECNTIVIIVLNYFLDMLRLQVTLFVICLVSWMSRSSIIVFIVVYFNVIIANVMKPINVAGLTFKGLYIRMIVNQRGIYLYGISIKDYIVIPCVIWLILLIASYLVFRFYRKDMLKN